MTLWEGSTTYAFLGLSAVAGKAAGSYFTISYVVPIVTRYNGGTHRAAATA